MSKYGPGTAIPGHQMTSESVTILPRGDHSYKHNIPQPSQIIFIKLLFNMCCLGRCIPNKKSSINDFLSNSDKLCLVEHINIGDVLTKNN